MVEKGFTEWMNVGKAKPLFPGHYGLVLTKSEPKYFSKHLKMAMDCVSGKADEQKIIFIKSWNEWAEGNYLEPDLKYGTQYLEVIKEQVLD